MPQTAGVDEVLKAAIDRGDVPGVVAMAATCDGAVYEGACGRRALPDGAAMTADTVFWLASMTKAITSTAAMQLVEAGKLALILQILSNDGPWKKRSGKSLEERENEPGNLWLAAVRLSLVNRR